MGHFRPEFLNRIDDIKDFWSHSILNRCVRLLTHQRKLFAKLKIVSRHGWIFNKKLAHVGARRLRPKFPARILKRLIQNVLDPLALELIDGTDGDTVKLLLMIELFLQTSAIDIEPNSQRALLKIKPTKTYQERMNQTASSKFGVIAKRSGENVKLLDLFCLRQMKTINQPNKIYEKDRAKFSSASLLSQVISAKHPNSKLNEAHRWQTRHSESCRFSCAASAQGSIFSFHHSIQI